MKRMFLMLALALTGASCFANPVGLEQAKKVAASCIPVKSSQVSNSPKHELKLEKQGSIAGVGYPLYYIFNRSNGGYVIAAGDDFFNGVLAYSESGKIDSNNMPENMVWWLNEYEKMAKHAIKNHIKLNALKKSEKAAINPLLTCTWDQGFPFNSMCPRDANGERCLTGCVATAMAQVMYYHRWPETGLGTNTYSFNINNDPSQPMVLSADFGNTTYRWDDMLDSYMDGNISDAAYNAVATLMLHCGIALEMVYGTEGSSPTRMNEARALKRYFKYYYDVINLQHVSDEDFDEIVYNELAEKRPVLVGGTDKVGGNGHLFVCDGYQNGYFHINWGWSGAGDTYCHPDALIPAVGNHDYSEDHRLIYNIRPYRGEIPDGPVEVTTNQAGTLAEMMPEMTPYAKSLKVSGSLNGTDMLTLRKMCGRDENEVATDGMIVDLDLEDATFVPGGDIYCENYTVTDKKVFPNHGLYYTNLERIVLPWEITKIDKCAFEMCEELREVILNENLETIEQEAFYHCTNLTSIILPKKLIFIDLWAFDGDDKLAEIHSYATTPPIAFETTFSLTCYENATLYVPQGSKSAYQETEPWSFFKNIVEMGEMVERVPQAIWTKGNTTLTFIYNEKVYKEGDTFNGQTVTNVWNNRYEDYADGSIYKMDWHCDFSRWNADVWESVTNAVFDPSFMDFILTDTRGWFSHCLNLENISGIEYLNTSKVKYMDDMFCYCKSLSSLDLSSWKTRNVESMQRMFFECNSLKSLNIENFNTSKVTNMHFMFFGCNCLVSLDLSSFDTRNVTEMGSMFMGCSSLTSLDVYSFNTEKVKNMCSMFDFCKNLTSLDITNFNTEKVKNMACMFEGCSSLSSLDVSNFNTENVESMIGMFEGCSSLTSLDVNNFNTKNVEDMSSMFEGCGSLTSLDVSNFDTKNVKIFGSMFKNCGSLTSLNLSNFDMRNATIGIVGFEGCDNLIELNVNDVKIGAPGFSFSGLSKIKELDLKTFDTKEATGMNSMFRNCSNLTELDLSGFDTRNVTDMQDMFSECSSLTSLDLSSFDTRNVERMHRVFSGCNNLTSLDLSNFDTSHVKDMSSMFSRCSGLTSLDLSNFDTSLVTNMYYMFYDCSSLTSLDLSSFDTGKVKNLEGMFRNLNLKELDVRNFKIGLAACNYSVNLFAGNSNLKTLNLSNFDTSEATQLDYLFYGCSSLTSIDLSSFDTRNVERMHGVFSGCNNLTSLDLSNFDTRNVEDMVSMFEGCNGLRNMSLGKGFNTENVTNDWRMFSDVSNLTVYVDTEAMPIVDASLKKLGLKESMGYTTSTEELTARILDGVNYWYTYYNSVASMTVPEGVDAYTGAIDGDRLVLAKIEDGIIPKGNAVILYATTDNIILEVNTVPKSIICGNVLQGVDVDTPTPENSYTLSHEGDVAGFYQATGEKLAAHSAFLQNMNGDNVPGYILDGEIITTSISQLQQAASQLKGNIYNLHGQRLSNPQKGLNIVNGKKVYVK